MFTQNVMFREVGQVYHSLSDRHYYFSANYQGANVGAFTGHVHKSM